MIHVLCPECSETLSHIYPAYEKVKNAYFDKIMRENGNIDLDKVDFKEDFLPSISFIFEALHINNQCCRVHILGVTDFDL